MPVSQLAVLQRQGTAPWAPTTLRQPAPQPAALHRRRKLTDLDAHLHCSILGTCLTLGELRNLVLRCGGQQWSACSDLEIHEQGVRMSSDAQHAKELTRALDRKFAAAIKRFDQVKLPEQVAALWEESKRNGEIPSGYWCLITHPATTVALLQKAVGDVHMLSHLVGASNRADIRRLAELEARCAELEDKAARQQARLHELSTARDAATRELSSTLARFQQTATAPASEADETADATEYLRDVVARLERRIEHEVRRRERAEQTTRITQDRLAEVSAQHAVLAERDQGLREELELAERVLEHPRDATAPHRASHALVLAGQRVLYVGGRPGAVQAIRAFCDDIGCTLEHHDGGIDDRRSLLESRVARADVVMFPVDMVSHDAMWTLKRACRQSARPMFALRSSGVASFMAALDAWQRGQAPADTAPETCCAAHAS